MRDSREMRDSRAILSALYTVLTEAHAMRRYAEESERQRREVIGDV